MNEENPKMYSINTGEIRDFNDKIFSYNPEWYIICNDCYYPIYDQNKFIGHRFKNEICLPGRTMPE